MSDAEQLARLRGLRDSGAISQADFDRLSAAVVGAESGAGPARGLVTGSGSQGGPSMLRIAGSVAGGVVAGSLAADFLSNALADPPPEVLTAEVMSTTTLTDGGYVTDTTVTWENASGDVVAEQDITTTALYEEPQGYADYQQADTYAGGDFGGMEF